MDLDAEGKKVYLVHQQDRSVKAQPMDWFYGKSRPNIHIGVPAAEYDWRDKKNTYIERVVTGEEIGSLTGCYSTEKSENIVVFSDKYFEKAEKEWKKNRCNLGNSSRRCKELLRRSNDNPRTDKTGVDICKIRNK